jgi:hypothetical protein
MKCYTIKIAEKVSRIVRYWVSGRIGCEGKEDAG